jgi:predicted secreted protein
LRLGFASLGNVKGTVNRSQKTPLVANLSHCNESQLQRMTAKRRFSTGYSVVSSIWGWCHVENQEFMSLEQETERKNGAGLKSEIVA